MMQTTSFSWPIFSIFVTYLRNHHPYQRQRNNSIVWYSESQRKDFMRESYVKTRIEFAKYSFKSLQSFVSRKHENVMCCDFKNPLCCHQHDYMEQSTAVSFSLVHIFLCSLSRDGKIKCPHT